jgi:hypothetical protein
LRACSAIETWVGSALIDINSAGVTGVTWSTQAGKTIHQIRAHPIVLARMDRALIDVSLAVVARVPSSTGAVIL